MPGFLKTKDESSNLIFGNNGSEFYANNFYGFVYSPADGSLVIKEINDKSELIELPESEEPSYNDQYLYWVWSGVQLEFSWENQFGNRLIMEVN